MQNHGFDEAYDVDDADDEDVCFYYSEARCIGPIFRTFALGTLPVFAIARCYTEI